ncbi:MAG TPA: hypothetical protein VG478_03955 [Acidimicrobiales bacterium]|jgi:hypothetical protein|nr:hypothetical protein [Acidimicrobiales bacterium]
MRTLFRTSRRTDPGDLLARWARNVPLSSGSELRECAEELVETLAGDSSRIRPALVRFGRQAGADGWTLADVSSWLEALIALGEPTSRSLSGFDAGTALASGWAEGFLRGATVDGCLDPATGLVTLPVLRLRLDQVHDQCRALGLSPADVYCLVVADLVVPGVGPLRRHALHASLAEEVRQLFDSGETLAIHGGRVLVLASRTPGLPAKLGLLERKVREHSVLRHRHVLTWIEPLPSDFAALDAYLDEVTQGTS